MKASAFCPAHITGFFKAEMVKSGGSLLETGSVGAGFSIRHGVRTTVEAEPVAESGISITTDGYETGDTAVSERVIARYAELAGRSYKIDVHHEIGVPVGYGLGCSAAVALSLSLALNAALGTNLTRKEAAQLAHTVEIECGTGLGDVAAALDGGFEIRTSAGAPGVGSIERTDSDLDVILVCLAPMSTRKFIKDELERINGLGGRMVDELRGAYTDDRFLDMSARFARYVDVITPRMQKIIDELAASGIRCGVALFGETVFVLANNATRARALEILAPYGKHILHSGVDNIGARLD